MSRRFWPWLQQSAFSSRYCLLLLFYSQLRFGQCFETLVELHGKYAVKCPCKNTFVLTANIVVSQISISFENYLRKILQGSNRHKYDLKGTSNGMRLLLILLLLWMGVLFWCWWRCQLARIESHHPKPAFHCILWGNDAMDFPESHGLRFDLIRHVYRLK